MVRSPLSVAAEVGLLGGDEAATWTAPGQALPRPVLVDLRTDHAGEVGAVCIYKGILMFARDPALRVFAEHHLATEQTHLDRIKEWLPKDQYSRLLPVWRLAGFMTGALPALFGPKAVYATIEAVETFVDQHYEEQVQALASQPTLTRLRQTLMDCQADEVAHRDEAATARGLQGMALFCVSGAPWWLGGRAMRSRFAVTSDIRVMSAFGKTLRVSCWDIFWGLLICAFFSGSVMAQSHDFSIPQNRATVYLMGEVHDNPHGHSMRIAHIEKLIGQGLRPVLAMEQFDRENQAALDQALSTCPDADCVIAKATTPGWEWHLYKPLIQWGLDKKVTLKAANLSNADVRKVMRDGFAAVFNPALINQYKLDVIPANLLTAQNLAIQEGHCNMLPPQAIGPMAKGQIARDVWMAQVINAADAQTVVLIAGNGHVRKDAGVYQWLSPSNQRRAQVHGYVEGQSPNDQAWFDHVHPVPAIDREDPCLVFKKQRIPK